MIGSVINEIVEKLCKSGLKDVHSAYDAVSVERKSRNFYTIVAPDTFEFQQPIYSPVTVFMPYKAEIYINVTAPENYSMHKLYEYFSENIKPVIMENSGMDCYIKKVSMKHDTQISRLVISAKISVTGIEKYERE
ncbi:MAG: hypothetical protein K2K89_08955 [Ruminococcus sp.]|nr:hypothetical protein [Ruminococcus sp.]